MWLRNLLFLGLVGGGITALAVNLIPSREPTPLTVYDGNHHRLPAFHAIVEQVNASFHQQWLKNSLNPTSPAPDLSVARRLSLGLMGTVPSLEEIRQFERLPPNERLTWWVDHILEDRRYADYFAERLARACVGTEDGPFIFYRRRRLVSWIGDQLAANQSYDHLVHDLIAGEGLWTDKPATNFVTVTSQQDHENQPDPVRLAGRVTRAFLGLRLDCAQCHNHPFADWKQADFQALSAFFGQTHLGFTGIHEGSGEYEVEDLKTKTSHTVQPRVPFAQNLLPENGNRRHKLAEWVTSPKNPFFARATVNRVWALMAGRPLVEPVDNLESDMPAPPALKLLADDFAAHGFDLRRLIRVIAATEVFRLDSVADHEVSEDVEKAWAVFPMTRLRPEQVIGSVSQACSLGTIDGHSHVVVRLIRYGQQNDFVKRYGDSGEDEFDSKGGTIPQRLLMMNGTLIAEKIKDSPFNASSRIAFLAPNDARAVETAYLAVLTRRPTPEEATYFEAFLADDSPLSRNNRLEDLYWTLLNSTEFSWNH
jgi:hypothetical protein